jgi:2'-5' RNA ligase
MLREPEPAKRRRLFFALWPSDELRTRIHAATRTLVRESGGRAIPPQNFHMTLVFLGDVLDARFDAVLQAAVVTTGSAFDMVLDRIESFPGSNVLCLTCSRTPTALNALVEQLRFSLLGRQFDLGRQVFRPHLTLARDLPRMRAVESFDGFHWQADEFVLVDSQLLHGGSQYTVIGRWPLQPG